MTGPKTRAPRGGGSVFELADGRWRAQVDLGLVNGKRLRKTKTCATEREARAALTRLRGDGKAEVRTKETTGAWVNYWLDNVASKRVREATLPGYRSKMNLYVIPTIGRVKLARLESSHIEKAWQKMHDDGLSPATIRQTHAILSRCLEVAVQRDMIPRNPCRSVELEHVDENPHARWTPDECRRVLSVTCDVRERLRVTCGVLLAMRPSEVLGLQWDDIAEDDPRMPHLVVNHGLREVTGKGLVLTPPKSKRSRRVIPLPASVAADFATWRAASPGTGFVFFGDHDPTKPTQPKKDWQDWRDLQKRLTGKRGQPNAAVPYVSPHGARGSAASLLADEGVPMVVVQAILGHASITTTARHYAIAADESQAKALQQAADILAGPAALPGEPAAQ